MNTETNTAPVEPTEPTKAKPAKAAKVAKVKPAKTAKAKAAKPAKAKAAKAKAKPAKVKATNGKTAPTGRVAEILKLASRAKGTTPAQLNELTKWKVAPWKWLFSNPKGTGYCDRWGYDFEATRADGETRYKVAKR
jgi:hypothetical protein